LAACSKVAVTRIVHASAITPDMDPEREDGDTVLDVGDLNIGGREPI